MSIFSKVGSWFKKVFGSAAKDEQVVSATLAVIAPLTETIIALTAGEPAAAAIAAIVKEVQVDLATAATLATTAGGSSVTIKSFLDAVVSNLKTLLSAGQIKDPVTATKVSATITGIIEEVEAILPVVTTL